MILRPFPLRDRLWQQPGTSYLPSLLAAVIGVRPIRHIAILALFRKLNVTS